MEGEYRIFFAFSACLGTLKNAGTLLSVARKISENQNLIAACSVVIAASALDQAIRTVLTAEDCKWALNNSCEPGTSPFTEFLSKSFRSRLHYLPRLLSNGRFHLDRNHECTKALDNMIDIRNQLLHIDDDVYIVDETDSRVSISDNDQVQFKFHIPEDQWNTISVDRAQILIDAAKEYIDLIFQNEPNKWTAGGILSTKSQGFRKN